MKIRDEKIEIFCNGKCIDTTHLNRGYQSAVFYFENEDAAEELAQGKTKLQAKAGTLQRAAKALFNGALKNLNELSKLDAAAADAILAEIYSGFTIANEARPGGGANLKSLEQRAAATFFAWQDANTILENRAGIPHAQLLTNLCFNVQEEHENGRTDANKRTREALRLFKETQAKAETEARRELSPEGQAIYEQLASLEEVLADLDPEEAEKRMEEAEAPLDALALKDPEEATRIFNRSSYFDYEDGDGDIYLGAGVFCRRDELKKLDTPEKRAAYIETGVLPGEDEPSAGDLPLRIFGGDAVNLKGREPV